MVAEMNPADRGFAESTGPTAGGVVGEYRKEQCDVISHQVQATDPSACPVLPFHSTSAHIMASLVIISITSGLHS